MGAENSRDALASPDQELVAASWKGVVVRAVLEDLDDKNSNTGSAGFGTKQFTMSLTL